MKTNKRRRTVRLFLIAVLVIGGFSLWRYTHQLYCDQALLSAIKRGDSAAVLDLLASGANPNVRSPGVLPPSFRTRLLRLLGRPTSNTPIDGLHASALSCCPERINGTDVFDVSRENTVIVNALLRYGAKVDATDDLGQTALGWAVVLQHTDTVRLFLEHGANPNTYVCQGKSLLISMPGQRLRMVFESRGNPLLIAAFHSVVYECSSPDIAHLLIEHSASISSRSDTGETPLWSAVCADDRQSVSLLLSRGADVNARDREGRTILGYTVQYTETCGPIGVYDPQMQRILVEAGGKE